MMQSTDDRDADLQIRTNIQQTYLFKLQEVTRQLRHLEKQHLLRMKDLYGDQGEIILDQLEKKEGGYFADLDRVGGQDRDLVSLEEVGDMVKGRDADVKKLVRQINELAVIFKELSILVVQQGTVLDRIDYNILEARTQVEKGNKELEKTVKSETSSRSKGVMTCLVTSNLVMGFLFVLKFI